MNRPDKCSNLHYNKTDTVGSIRSSIVDPKCWFFRIRIPSFVVNLEPEQDLDPAFFHKGILMI
jgi:hypothetical protein